MSIHTYWVTAVSYTLVALIILIKNWSLRGPYEKKNHAFIMMSHAMLLFSIQDTLWALCFSGIISNTRVFFIVSQLFHFTWSLTAFCWLYYILDYLGSRRGQRIVLLSVQGLFVLLGLAMVLYNRKVPLLFSIENGQYYAIPHRWFTFIFQYYVYILTGLYALYQLVLNRRRLRRLRSRYIAICCASLAPVFLGIVTIGYTDVPFYSMGFVFSCFVLYVFVVTSDYDELRKQKVEFLRGMSHELRTPLNAMYGFAQLLGMPTGAWTDKEREQYNTYIYNSYNMLDMLINDLMVSTSSDMNQYHIENQSVDVERVCRDAMSLVEFCKPVGVDMQVKVDLPAHFSIQSDPRRIQQILFNLLTNACRFTTQGRIVLQARLQGDTLELSVQDNSKLLPVEEVENVFDPTTQCGEHAQKLGLKLPVCRKVARSLGGDVHFDTSFKEGCCLVLTLRAAQSEDNTEKQNYKSTNKEKQHSNTDAPQKADILEASAKHIIESKVMITTEEICSLIREKKVMEDSNATIVVVDENLRILYVNDTPVAKEVALCPGDLIKCNNAVSAPKGCGSHENCKDCELRNMVNESVRTNKKMEIDADFLVDLNHSLSVHAVSTPYEYKGKTGSIVLLIDRTEQQRELMLERTFFHDLLNISGALKGLLDCVQHDNVQDIIPILRDISSQLIDEVATQRDLIYAMNGLLKPKYEKFKANEVLENIDALKRLAREMHHVEVVTESTVTDEKVESDKTLVNRVLFNMLKNAYEASPNSVVTFKISTTDEQVVYSVHNDAVIPEHVKSKIFIYGNSTKDAKRGLGTYSMKLIGENFLKGKVWFESKEGLGTTFYFALNKAK